MSHTKLYELEIPMRLRVEANSVAEARTILRTLYREVLNEGLPVGAGVFMQESDLQEALRNRVSIV